MNARCCCLQEFCGHFLCTQAKGAILRKVMAAAAGRPHHAIVPWNMHLEHPLERAPASCV
jgi:hypothetical protein